MFLLFQLAAPHPSRSSCTATPSPRRASSSSRSSPRILLSVELILAGVMAPVAGEVVGQFSNRQRVLDIRLCGQLRRLLCIAWPIDGGRATRGAVHPADVVPPPAT